MCGLLGCDNIWLVHEYCHAYEWLWMEFGLVIGFIEHLQTVTTSNYSTTANSHSAIHYSTHFSPLSLLCFTGCLLMASNKVLCFCAHILTGWQLSQNCQLSTWLHSTNSTQLVKWYSLGVYPTENTAPVDVGGVVSRVPLPDHVAVMLPAALLLLHNITADAYCDVILHYMCNHWHADKLFTLP
jgi:hypothetical protein